MITFTGLRNREKLIEVAAKDVKKFLKEENNLIWIDLEKPTEEDFSQLQELFNFHPLCIEDCKSFSELPKVDDYGEYLFVIIHRIAFEKESREIALNELDFFLGKNYIVTVHMYESEALHEIRDKINANPKLFSDGTDFLMYVMIDKVIDKYFPVVDTIDDLIDELEDLAINNKDSDTIATRSLRIRRDIAMLKRVAGPQREVINRLARRESTLITVRTAIYFRDVYDNIMRIYQMLESQRDLIASAFEAYLSMTNNRLNEVMKKLTVIATIFLPLTFITGIYGMNFDFMPELSSPYGYPAVLLITLAVGSSFFFYFRRKGWA